MRYLIYCPFETDKIRRSFRTEWFIIENHYSEGMIVFDFSKSIFTDDGENWHLITDDHL